MNTPSTTNAKKNQVVGDAKETVGNLVGNESLQAKGQAQNGEGKVEETTANVSRYVEGLINQGTGVISGTVNALTGNSTDKASDKAQEKKGEVQKELS